MPWVSNNPNAKNSGSLWTTEQEAELVRMLSSGMNVAQCAAHFERTEGGISSRRMIIARELIKNGRTLEDVSAILNAPIASIQQSLRAAEISAENEKKRQETKKKPQTQLTFSQIVPAVQEETQLSILKEIRDLLKEVLMKI